MIFEIPLEHFPQPFAMVTLGYKNISSSNFIKATSNLLLSKMRESLSIDYKIPFIISNDSYNKETPRFQTNVESKRKMFAQKYNSKNVSIDINTNISLLSLKEKFHQNIAKLKSYIFASTDQPLK
uniref:Condensation domain-containing protein n=1 Tax=Strongyloides venezuelensis TaxID=75913 RepID=A0A0K0EW86_STRVS